LQKPDRRNEGLRRILAMKKMKTKEIKPNIPCHDAVRMDNTFEMFQKVPGRISARPFAKRLSPQYL
jgi:hypothetical protein